LTKQLNSTKSAGRVSHSRFDNFEAKYHLDTLLKEKRDISKIVAEKKKASKGQDKCEEEVAKSKAIDIDIQEQKKITD
jgi:hypothetical protein